MDVIDHNTWLVLALGLAALTAVAAHHLSGVISIPAPVLFLAAGLAIPLIMHDEHLLTFEQVSTIGTFALVLILFNGGYEGGWRRTRRVLGPVVLLGIPGTLLTAALMACAGHWLLGLSWEVATLVGVALAPTDPAAVFSVLAGNRIRGNGDVILEGESGANDPVGVALMIGAIEYFRHDGSVVGIGIDVSLELALGIVVGIALGAALRQLMDYRSLGHGPAGAMLGVAGAMVIYASAALLGGSGFLAAYVAGLIAGDTTVSDERTQVSEVVGFGALAAEATMFAVLGMTIDLGSISGNLVSAAVLFAVLTLVIRPVVVAACLAGSSASTATKLFVSWGGLKGAVPILLATFPIMANMDGEDTIHAITFVVVAASIIVQGSTLAPVARRLKITAIEPAPQ